MLPPFIIEQIRKREEDRRQHERPLHLELPLVHPEPMRRPKVEDDIDRGVIIVELGT